jgi:multicomponent Na+:H+ antiporter subunit F
MQIAITLLIILLMFSALRIMMGPTLWDRMLGVNMVASKLMMVIILYASLKKQNFILDIALIYALLGFIGIIFMSIYIQGKGRY